MNNYQFPVKCIGYYAKPVTISGQTNVEFYEDDTNILNVQYFSVQWKNPLDVRLFGSKTTELNKFIDSNSKVFYLERTTSEVCVFDEIPKHWLMLVLASKS